MKQRIDETIIKKFLKKENILLYFQPIYSFKEKKITNFEVLGRLKVNEHIINPFVVINKLNKTDFYEIYKNYIFSEINKIITEKKEYKFSINLYASDIEKKDLYGLIKNNVDPKNGKNIIFELIEEEKIHSYQNFINIIKKIKKEYNIGLAMDDFGTEYNNIYSFVLLKEILNYVKINGAITKYIINEKEKLSLIKKIVDLFYHEEKKIKIIYEFVEDKKIFNFLKNIKVDYVQGYYVGFPISLNELKEKY